MTPLASIAAAVALAAPVHAPALQSAADRVVAHHGPPGTVVETRRDGHVTSVAAGLANTKTGERMRTDDHFQIASITKTFVSTVVLQLDAEGKLSLDDPVSKYVADIPAGITIRDLLQHTSGLHEYLEDPRFGTAKGIGATYTPRELVDIALKLGPPQQGWHYANTNYILAGMIVEQVTGKSIQDQVKTRIIDPLKLTETSFPSTPTPLPAPFAHGYMTPNGDVTGAINPTASGASGAMVSTTDDLARFYGALLGGKLLPAKQLGELKAAIPVKDEGELYPERYGLGLYRVKLPCGFAWGHDGGYVGYRSIAYSSADGSHQAVMFFNDSGAGTDKPKFRNAVKRAMTVAFCGR